MSEQAPVRAAAPAWADAPAAWLRIVWAIALALPLLWMLGGVPLFDVDEGAFSEATREMITSGDWGHTTLNGAPRFDKPIGVYWLQAASVSIFGLGEFALRLPSALSCWLMALALAAFARRRWGEIVGMLAGVLTVTSLGPQAIGRAATADGLLNLLLVLATLDLWRFAESEAKGPLRRAYLWVGLGLLVKGPVAVVVPGAAFVLFGLVDRRWAMLRKSLLDPVAWALLLVVSVPWYAYALQRHGMAFIDGFLMRHNVDRFTGTIGGHRGNFLYYVLVLPVLAMPWAPLLVAAVVRARSFWREPAGRFLLLWGGFVLVFFSLSGTKLPHYMLYGYPPMVLLMARMLAQPSKRLAVIVGTGIVVWAAIVAVVPWALPASAGRIRDPLYHALFAGAPAASWLPPACMLVAVLLLLVFWRRRPEAAPLRIAAAGGVVALFAAGWMLPWIGDTLQGPVRRAAAAAAAHGGPAVQWNLHLPTFSVYLRQQVPKRDPLPGEMALTRVDRLPPGDAGRPRLFEERGIVLLGPQRAQ